MLLPLHHRIRIERQWLVADDGAGIVIHQGVGDFVTASRTTFQDPDVTFIGINIGAMDARKMRALPVNDFEMKDVKIRADGQVMRPWYLVTIKSREDSKYPYDYYKLISTISAEEAFRPMADGGCSLVK